MTPTRRAYLREIMVMAWSLYRADLNGPSPRSFADALMGAWRWFKGRPSRLASRPAWAKGERPMHLPLRSMVQSPIRRALTGPYGEAHASARGYVTSVLGR